MASLSYIISVGVEEVNFDLYPDESFQIKWLRTYLQERARLTGEGRGNEGKEGGGKWRREEGRKEVCMRI